MLYPDKRLFVDSVTIQVSTGQDEWQSKTFASYTIDNVRFIRKNVYSGTGNSVELISVGTVYILPYFSSIPSGLTIDDTLFTGNAQITINGHNYHVSSVSYNENLYDSGIYDYEIGVS